MIIAMNVVETTHGWTNDQRPNRQKKRRKKEQQEKIKTKLMGISSPRVFVLFLYIVIQSFQQYPLK